MNHFKSPRSLPIGWLLDGFRSLLLVLCLGFFSVSGQAADFDHLRTGFALKGAHANVKCESCHIGGLFKGVPRDCESCHTAGTSFARGNTVKPITHIITRQSCDTCHSASTFNGAKMDHSGVNKGSCASCHNGMQAAGKTANHVLTSASCDSCHKTTGWLPATGFDHSGVTSGSCATCHNGQRATGRPSSHVPYSSVSALSSLACDSCHKAGFASWTPAKVHANNSVSSQCSSCHLSIRPATAIHTGQTVCESCHKSTTSWAAGKVDHSTFTVATNCASCHNGGSATGKPSQHIPVGATNCIACHNTTGWKPTKWNHTQVGVSNCASCHSGAFPPADGKPATHVPYQTVATMAAMNCDGCHKAGFASWTPAKVHTSVSVSSQCSSCHLSVRPATAIHTGQTVCESCHKSTASWSAAKVDHSTFTVATNCASCHNGGSATGKPSQHIPVGATNCIACHNTTGWKPTKWNHTQVPVIDCTSCHNGAYPPADGRPVQHIPYLTLTGVAVTNCSTCHKGGFASWANGKFHANVSVNGQCKTCHNGAYTSQGATPKPTNHIPENQLLNGAAMECNACHTSTTAWTQRMNHNGSQGGGAGWCKSCHASGTAYLGSMEKKALTHRTKTPVPLDCSEAGCHRPLGNKGAAYTRWD